MGEYRKRLPQFAAFDRPGSDDGFARRRAYYLRYAEIATAHGLGLLLEVRAGFETPATPVAISGNLGPRGDGYRAEARMSVAEARDDHAWQIGTFAATAADLVSVFTMNHVEEAIGVAAAAKERAMPVLISFTPETDGLLPSGQRLAEAIEQTDAAADGHPAYYIINCAHPTHFVRTLRASGGWRDRRRGLRANASRRSTPSSTPAPSSTMALRRNSASRAGRCGRCGRG